MEITGKLHLKYDEVQINDKFKKREFVLYVENERNIDWSDHIKFQLIQDKTDLIDATKEGDTIKVHFNLRGREFAKGGKTSYFNSIDAWRIEPIAAAEPKNDGREPKVIDELLGSHSGDENDDLPF